MTGTFLVVALMGFVLGLIVGAIIVYPWARKDTLRLVIEAISAEYSERQAAELHQLILRALRHEAERLTHDH